MNTMSDNNFPKMLDAWARNLAQRCADDDANPQPEPETPRTAKPQGPPPFALEGVHPQVRAAHAAVAAWLEAARTRSSRPYWLSLLGVCGCGKTHLLRLAHRTLKNRGCQAQLWLWRCVLDMLHSGASDIMRHLRDIPYLLIDDVGAEFSGTAKALDFSLGTLCELLDSRIHRWTMLTSNLLMKDLAAEDARVASRLVRHGNSLATLDQAQDYALSQYKARHAT